jgi:hypothetical protein
MVVTPTCSSLQILCFEHSVTYIRLCFLQYHYIEVLYTFIMFFLSIFAEHLTSFFHVFFWPSTEYWHALVYWCVFFSYSHCHNKSCMYLICCHQITIIFLHLIGHLFARVCRVLLLTIFRVSFCPYIWHATTQTFLLMVTRVLLPPNFRYFVLFYVKIH